MHPQLKRHGPPFRRALQPRVSGRGHGGQRPRTPIACSSGPHETRAGIAACKDVVDIYADWVPRDDILDLQPVVARSSRSWWPTRSWPSAFRPSTPSRRCARRPKPTWTKWPRHRQRQPDRQPLPQGQRRFWRIVLHARTSSTWSTSAEPTGWTRSPPTGSRWSG